MKTYTITIASDHAGYQLKQIIVEYCKIKFNGRKINSKVAIGVVQIINPLKK